MSSGAARRRSGAFLAASLSLGPAVAIGLARFGYALLLPAMREELGWSFAVAGSMNTANALGYMAGALSAAPLAGRLGAGRAFTAGMFLVALSLVATGLTASEPLLLALRALAGLAGAVAFVAGAGLAARLASRGPAPGLTLGLYFGGVGIGIAVTALGLPPMLHGNPESWRLAWLAMGAASLLAAAWAGHAARQLPAADAGGPSRALPLPVSRLIPALLAYFLFGLGYISYMTFVVAYLAGRGGSAADVSLFWAVLGAATICSAFVWSRAIDRLRGGVALASVLAVVAAGVLLPLVSTVRPVVLASGLLFGSSFLSVVAVVTEIVRRLLPERSWAAGIALFTVVFSVGQALGPLASGALADLGPGLSLGLGLSVAVLALGALVALAQRERP